MSEYVVDFGDKSSAFVGLAIAEAESHGATLKERVVRCRDCKHYTPESVDREERGFGVYENVWEPGGCFNPERCSHGGDPFGEWYVVGIDTEPDGFCAWGERRDA